MTTNADRKPTILHYGGDGRFVIEGEGEDRIVLGEGQVVEACFAASDMPQKLRETFLHQFDRLCRLLVEWIDERRDRISAAYLTLRRFEPVFVVVQADVPRDDELVNALTDLDIRLANAEEFTLINLDVLSMPKVGEEGLSSFLSQGKVVDLLSTSDAE